MSVSNLKKTFKKYSDEGVISYFNKMKIRKSIDLLKQDLSIGEISEMLSFSSRIILARYSKKKRTAAHKL
jgi:AraC-like DNA-binding protein